MTQSCVAAIFAAGVAGYSRQMGEDEGSFSARRALPNASRSLSTGKAKPRIGHGELASHIS